MRLSAVFACLRLLSEAIATLPLDTFIRNAGARQPYRPKPDYLSFQPPQGARSDYLSQVMLSLLTDGNAFIATPRDDLGIPTTLVVLDPTQVTVRRVGRDPLRVRRHTYDQTDLMHIKGMCLPGAAARPVAAGLRAGDDQPRPRRAAVRRGVLRQRRPPGAVIEAPGRLLAARSGSRVAAMWNARHKGVANASEDRRADQRRDAEQGLDQPQRGAVPRDPPVPGAGHRPVLRCPAAPDRRCVELDVVGLRSRRAEPRLRPVLPPAVGRPDRDAHSGC
jgi:hypothetical protein